MSSDIEGNASLDLTKALRDIRALRGEIKGLTTDTQKLNTTGRDSQAALSRRFKDVGQAAGKSGSPVGSWSSKFLGGAGMEGGLARVAVGLAVVTTAFRAYDAVVAANVARAQMMIDAQKRLKDSLEATDKALKGQAAAGESQAGIQRRLVAAGGQQAKDDVDFVAGLGVTDRAGAEQGVADIYDRYGKSVRAKNAVDIAARAARAGVPFADAAKQTLTLGGGLDDSSNGDVLAGRIVRKITGARGAPQDIMKKRLGNVADDPFLQSYERTSSISSALPGIQRDRFVERGEADARAAMGEARNPGAAEAAKLHKLQEEQLAALRLIAAATGGLKSLWQDLTNPEGSAATQLLRLQQANAGALGLGTPRGPAAKLGIPSGFGFSSGAPGGVVYGPTR